jgi:hypothetical protein
MADLTIAAFKERVIKAYPKKLSSDAILLFNGEIVDEDKLDAIIKFLPAGNFDFQEPRESTRTHLLVVLPLEFCGAAREPLRFPFVTPF